MKGTIVDMLLGLTMGFSLVIILSYIPYYLIDSYMAHSREEDIIDRVALGASIVFLLSLVVYLNLYHPA